MGTTENAIEVTGLVKSYGKLRVLERIDFTVQKGTVFALLGSNGAGKTTTVKILSTLLKPNLGSIKVFGYDLLNEAAKVRSIISLTGQFAAVDELLTGRENIRMITRLRHIKKKNADISGILDRLSLSDYADRRVSTYSGGIRRKLDLAMSLIGFPSIIFLDEPTTGLDPQSRVAMWEIIKELKMNGTTIFLTTQYLEEAEELGDRIVILDKGKIAADGTVSQLTGQLPHGLIEIRFKTERDLLSAYELLAEFSPRLNREEILLVAGTDGSAKNISTLFELISKSGTEIDTFKQIVPKLEDVFFSTIGKESKGGSYENN
jgi:ABC-2 type transport system ATP-binding protein